MKKFSLIFIFVFVVALFGTVLAACNNSNPVYSICVAPANHGQIYIDRTTAQEGEIVTLDIQPDLGYEVAALVYNDKYLSQDSFVMPAKDVTIFAYFSKIAEGEDIIHYNLGSYVSRIYGVTDDDDYISTDEWVTTFKIKENNRFDIVTAINGDVVVFENLIFTRDSNTISASVGGIQYQLEFIDESTILLNNDGVITIFCYEEDQQLPYGNFYGDIASDEQSTTILLDIEDDNIVFKTAVENNIVSQETCTYKVLGNRIYMFGKDATYISIVDVNGYGPNFSIKRIASFKENEFNSILSGADLIFNKQIQIKYGSYIVNSFTGGGAIHPEQHFSYDAIKLEKDSLNVGLFLEKGYKYQEKIPYAYIGRSIVFSIDGVVCKLSVVDEDSLQLNIFDTIINMCLLEDVDNEEIIGQYAYNKRNPNKIINNDSFVEMTFADALATIKYNIDGNEYKAKTLYGNYKIIGDTIIVACNEGYLVIKSNPKPEESELWGLRALYFTDDTYNFIADTGEYVGLVEKYQLEANYTYYKYASQISGVKINSDNTLNIAFYCEDCYYTGSGYAYYNDYLYLENLEYIRLGNALKIQYTLGQETLVHYLEITDTLIKLYDETIGAATDTNFADCVLSNMLGSVSLNQDASPYLFRLYVSDADATFEIDVYGTNDVFENYIVTGEYKIIGDLFIIQSDDKTFVGQFNEDASAINGLFYNGDTVASLFCHSIK